MNSYASMMLAVDAILVLTSYFHNQRCIATDTPDRFISRTFHHSRSDDYRKEPYKLWSQGYTLLLLTGYHKNSIVFISTIKWNSNICTSEQTAEDVAGMVATIIWELLDNLSLKVRKVCTKLYAGFLSNSRKIWWTLHPWNSYCLVYIWA